MNKKSLSKNKKSNRKTKRVIMTNEDATLLSNALTESVNNPILARYVKKVETTPTTKNMKEYVALINLVTKNNISKYGTYSPSINKRLESIREIETTDIFGCGAESVLKKSRYSDEFAIRVGSDSSGNVICAPATSKEAREVFMKNFKSNRILNPANIIAPMQSHANCWFNTMFMCFFVSDKGRKFMRFFRQLMIEGKLVDGKPILPKKLSSAFIMFNAAIEACYNNSRIKDNQWLALNTNNIIVNIYNSIPHMDGIKNIDEYGNPYKFYRDIMIYLNAKKNAISMEFYDKETDVANFYNSSNKKGLTPDVVIVALADYYDIIKAQSEKYVNKPLQLTYNGAVYELDSAISRDVTQNHFCCGIICNNEDYLFDGGAFSKLSKRPWRKWINKNYKWSPKGTDAVWNFIISYTMFFYYRVS